MCRKLMKEVTAVLSPTMLVVRLRNQLNLALVSIYSILWFHEFCNKQHTHCIISNCADNQTSNSANLSPGKDLTIRTRLWTVCILLQPFISTYSWASPDLLSSTRVKGCCSGKNCKVYHPCYWNRTSNISVGVEASRGDSEVATVS